ncbi:MAG: hypothetical protein ACRCSG_00850 [Cellulosilyticaceae bacterium]
MKLIVHDNDGMKWKELPSKDYIVIDASKPSASCFGCFGCWLKTPGSCVLKDSLKEMGRNLASVDEYIIVSEVNYGVFTPGVKRVLDRSISYLLPFFRIIDKEIHHVPRYKQQFDFKIYIYNSKNISDLEKDVLEKYIAGMAINMNAKSTQVYYIESVEEVVL